jgi:O-antigen ligase
LGGGVNIASRDIQEAQKPSRSLDPRARLAFIVLAIAVPLCMELGSRGFAPAMGVAGLLSLRFARPDRRDWPGLIILGGLVLWAGISALWSPAPNLHGGTTFKSLGRLTYLHLGLQLMLSGAVVLSAAHMQPEAARRNLGLLAVGLLVGIALLCIESVSRGFLYVAAQKLIGETVRRDHVIRSLGQSGFVVSLFVWPVGAFLYLRGWTVTAMALAAFVPLSTLFFRGIEPSAALLVSAPVFLAVLRFGRPAAIATLVSVAAYFLVGPWLMMLVQSTGLFDGHAPYLPASWNARLEIWNFVLDRLSERPLMGWGLDASRIFPVTVPLHPHNAALQLWFELGLPGAIFGGAFWIWLFWRLAKLTDQNRLAGAVGIAAATVYIVISMVGFGLWQEWWICAGALALAAGAMATKVIVHGERLPATGRVWGGPCGEPASPFA